MLFWVTTLGGQQQTSGGESQAPQHEAGSGQAVGRLSGLEHLKVEAARHLRSMEQLPLEPDRHSSEHGFRVWT